MTPTSCYTPEIAAYFPWGPPQGFPFRRGRKQLFKLTQPFRYRDPDKSIDVTVPAGTITDFNSVPRALWWWFAPQDCTEAGVVHDYLYTYPREGRTDGLAWTRREADDLWRRILHLAGMRQSKRGVGWLGVRVGAWWAWRRHRSRDAP